MTPFSERKLLEQVIIILGLVLALVKSYANWKIKYRYYSVPDLLFNISMVTLIVSGILVGLYFLIHQMERKWKIQLSRRGSGSVHPWQIRPASDCGITLLPLFPMALLLGLINFWQEITHPYMIVTVLSMGFLFTSMAYLWKTGQNGEDNSVNSLVTVAAISSVKVVLVLWHLRLLGLAGSCLVAFGSQVLFLLLLRILLLRCPRSFSIGEALMVSQGLTCLLLASCLWLAAKVFNVCGPMKKCYLGEMSAELTYAVVLGVASLLALVLAVGSMHRPVPFYLTCAALGCLYLYPTWFGILKNEPVLWLLRWTMYDSVGRSLLVVHWLACTVFSVAVVGWANACGVRITTTVRKLFHVAVILIYLPGTVWDVELLYLASSLVFALFIAVECVRVLRVPPFGKVIDVALKAFVDEKDSGNLILTHIYLLVGCSFSIWLFPLNHTFHISLTSGIMSLGFGDTAASVGGVLLGKHKWPDTRKTIEGTFVAFIVQGFATLLLYLLLSAPANVSMCVVNSLYLLLATFLCCMLEGVTTQIDNLLLPAFLYITLTPT